MKFEFKKWESDTFRFDFFFPFFPKFAHLTKYFTQFDSDLSPQLPQTLQPRQLQRIIIQHPMFTSTSKETYRTTYFNLNAVRSNDNPATVLIFDIFIKHGIIVEWLEHSYIDRVLGYTRRISSRLVPRNVQHAFRNHVHLNAFRGTW